MISKILRITKILRKECSVMKKFDLQIEELESAEEMMSDFAEGYCWGILVVGGILLAAT